MIFISLDSTSTPFAATKSNEVQTECETIEVANADAGDWRDYIAGKKAWSFTVNWLVGSANDIARLLSVGQTYSIRIYTRTSSTSTLRLSGSAICQQCKITATRGNISVGSFAFKGDGELTQN